MNKLKKHWGISSNNQLLLILLVFAVNGSLSGFITKPVMVFFGITRNSIPLFIYWLLYLLVITIVYFLLLIVISNLFGQASFFKKFAKRSLSPFGFKRFF